MSREDILKTVCESATSGNIVIVCGLPRRGKTYFIRELESYAQT